MAAFTDSLRLPMIDLSRFDLGDPWRERVAIQIDRAAREFGSFHVVGHGIDEGLVDSLMALSRRFFALEGATDDLFFDGDFAHEDGTARAASASRRNSSFLRLPGFRDVVADYMTALTGLGHKLMTSVARGSRHDDHFFVDHYTGDAKVELRIADHRPLASGGAVGYATRDRIEPGLLTLLAHDEFAGLQVEYGEQWLEVPPLPGALICHIGEILAQVTSGRYAPARYRLMNTSRRHGLSMPFNFDAAEPIASVESWEALAGDTRPDRSIPVLYPMLFSPSRT